VGVKISEPLQRVPGAETSSEEIKRTTRSYSAQSVTTDYDSGQLIEKYQLADRVLRLFGDSGLFDFGPWVEQCDLFFVDGSHQLDYVRNDTAVALKCCRPNGWVIWHDALIDQVMRVVREVAEHTNVRLIDGTNVAVSLRPPGPNRVQDFQRWRLSSHPVAGRG
jgi:hypothetical protein